MAHLDFAPLRRDQGRGAMIPFLLESESDHITSIAVTNPFTAGIGCGIAKRMEI